jgi:hypothetical protein
MGLISVGEFEMSRNRDSRSAVLFLLPGHAHVGHGKLVIPQPPASKESRLILGCIAGSSMAHGHSEKTGRTLM